MNNNTALNSASIKTPAAPSATSEALRDLAAAMPIVIVYKAARAALLQRRPTADSTLAS